MKPAVPRTSRLLMPRINAKRPLRALMGGGAAVALATTALLAQTTLLTSSPHCANASEIAVDEAAVQSGLSPETLVPEMDGDRPGASPEDGLTPQPDLPVDDRQPGDLAPSGEPASDGETALFDEADQLDEAPSFEDAPSGPDATLALATGVPMAEGISADPLGTLLQTVALRQEEGSPIRVVTADAATGSVVYFDAS